MVFKGDLEQQIGAGLPMPVQRVTDNDVGLILSALLFVSVVDSMMWKRIKK